MLPTGYAFNLDGTSLFMAMGLMFISHACGVPLSLDAQFGILVLMLLTFKGTATVSGDSFVVFAATVTSTGILPFEGLALKRVDVVEQVEMVMKPRDLEEGVDEGFGRHLRLALKQGLAPGRAHGPSAPGRSHRSACPCRAGGGCLPPNADANVLHDLLLLSEVKSAPYAGADPR